MAWPPITMCSLVPFDPFNRYTTHRCVGNDNRAPQAVFNRKGAPGAPGLLSGKPPEDIPACQFRAFRLNPRRRNHDHLKVPGVFAGVFCRRVDPSGLGVRTCIENNQKKYCDDRKTHTLSGCGEPAKFYKEINRPNTGFSLGAGSEKLIKTTLCAYLPGSPPSSCC